MEKKPEDMSWSELLEKIKSGEPSPVEITWDDVKALIDKFINQEARKRLKQQNTKS